jgi:hypothetical protein
MDDALHYTYAGGRYGIPNTVSQGAKVPKLFGGETLMEENGTCVAEFIYLLRES